MRASPTAIPAQRARSWTVTGPRLAAKRAATTAERLVPRELAGSRAGRPVVEQHDGLLLALHRPEADQPLLGQAEEDVVPVPAAGLDALALEQLHDLGPAQTPIAAERGAQQLGAALDVGLASPSCAQRRASAASRRGAQSASSQRTSSAAVKWIVPRISQVRTICRSSIARSTPRAVPALTPRADRPQRLVVVLRLQRARASGRHRRARRSGSAAMRWLAMRRSAMPASAMPAG